MTKPPCDIRSLAQAHTEDAIATLAAITKQADASPAARVSAAIALLDRGWGKSTQPISPDADPLEEATTDELRAAGSGKDLLDEGISEADPKATSKASFRSLRRAKRQIRHEITIPTR